MGAVVVVMGVAGAGKTTVGRLLAARLAVPFVDADDLHDAAAKSKIRAGHPLTEADRAPWLARVNAVLRAHPDGVVVACSALTADARRRLAEGIDGMRFVHLVGDPALLAERLTHRHGHFAGPDLLPSQLDTLEPPADAIVLDVAAPPEVLVDEALAALSS